MGCIKSLLGREEEEDTHTPRSYAGTESSSLVDEKGNVDSNYLSAAIIDPRVPFTKRQIFSLLNSWKGMRRNLEFAILVFIGLFKTDQNLQSMFQKFKDIQDDDELRSNEALEYHATMVMTTLDDAITRIDNYEFVHNLLAQTGASHKRFTHFEPTTFLAIKQPFLDAVRVTLGDRYTENMERIYTIAIGFLVDTMVQGMEDALASNGPAPVAPALRKMDSNHTDSAVSVASAPCKPA